MRQVEVEIPAGTTTEGFAAALQAFAAEHGLTVRDMGTLRTIPGSAHWHLRRDREPGTLEITFDPANSRLVIAVHANRGGTWTEEAINSAAMAFVRLMIRTQLDAL